MIPIKYNTKCRNKTELKVIPECLLSAFAIAGGMPELGPAPGPLQQMVIKTC